MSVPARRPLALVTAAACFAGTVAPVAASAAATPVSPPPASTRGLLDGLGSILGLVTAPVAAIIQGTVGSSGILPNVLPPALVDSLTGALTSLGSGDIESLVKVLSPDQLGQLLTSTVSSVQPVLNGLVGVVNDLVLKPVTAVADNALGQLSQLLALGIPTDVGTLDALASLLDGVSALLANSGIAALPIIGPLAAQLGKVAADLPIGTAKTAAERAAATAATAAVAQLTPAQLQALIAMLTGKGAGVVSAPLGGGASKPAAGGAAKAMPRATLSKLRITKSRKQIRFSVTCPASAPTACLVAPKVTARGRSVRASATTVRPGATKTLKANVTASLRKALKRSGGKVVARVATTGSTKGAVSRTLTVRKAS